MTGLPQASYVIIAASQRPHRTFATAQNLADVPYFGVVGTLAAGEGIDLYRLALQNDAGIDFGLIAQRGDDSVPMRFQLFDGSGQALGTWTLGGPFSPSVAIDLSSLRTGSTLYIGISSSDPSPVQSAGPISYQLWVAHEQSAVPTPVSGGLPGSLAVAALPVFNQPLSAPAATSGPVVASTSVDGSSGPPISQGSYGITAGALAIRMAGPSGGLLSRTDRSPTSEHETTELTPSRSASGSLAAIEPKPENEGQPAEPRAFPRAPSGLVVVRRPGGFPLLGTAAVGYWRTRMADPDGNAGTPPLGDWNREASNRLESPELVILDAPATEDGAITQPIAWSGRPGRGMPISISSALGVATVMTLNALLSQPIAGFDYLASRLYRGAGFGAFARRRKRVQ